LGNLLFTGLAAGLYLYFYLFEIILNRYGIPYGLAFFILSVGGLLAVVACKAMVAPNADSGSFNEET
jgi:hypothetical protein